MLFYVMILMFLKIEGKDTKKSEMYVHVSVFKLNLKKFFICIRISSKIYNFARKIKTL